MVLALASLVIGCGARTGLGEDVPLGPRDAGVDVGIDAPIAACPPLSDLGFRIEAGPTIAGEWQAVALGGDGHTVATLLSASDGSALLSIRTEEGERSHRLAGVHAPQVSVEVGVIRALGTDDRGQQSVYTATGLGELDVEAIVLEGGPLLSYDRPRWNGRRVVIAGTDARGVVVVEWAPRVSAIAWTFAGAGHTTARIAVDEIGRTHLLTQDAEGRGRVASFDVDGMQLGAPVALVGYFFRAVSFGWSDDGLGQPWIAAGNSGAGPAGGRLVVTRYRDDGAMVGGFTAGLGGPAIAGTIDLSTTPPLGHRHGYGVVTATRVDSPALFHGRGEDFVGDARGLPHRCDGQRITIASGPCGYVIACTLDGRVHTSLAVPPRPR